MVVKMKRIHALQVIKSSFVKLVEKVIFYQVFNVFVGWHIQL